MGEKESPLEGGVLSTKEEEKNGLKMDWKKGRKPGTVNALRAVEEENNLALKGRKNEKRQALSSEGEGRSPTQATLITKPTGER